MTFGLLKNFVCEWVVNTVWKKYKKIIGICGCGLPLPWHDFWFVVNMDMKWSLECEKNLPLLSFWWKSSECNDNISSNHSCPIPWIQGLFGMVPAMYVDLSPDRQSCIWTPSMWLTLSHVVSMEVFFWWWMSPCTWSWIKNPIPAFAHSSSLKVILRPITPYLIPGLLAAPVIVHLARLLPSVEQETRQ